MLGLLAVAALAACSGAAPAARPSTASIQLITLSPAPGAFVDAGTMVQARLYYVLPADYPGPYFVDPWFAVVAAGGKAVVRGVGAVGVTPVHEPRGYVTVEFPLLQVLRANRLAKPVQLWFTLEARVKKEGSQAVAHAGPFLFTAGAR